MEADDDYVTLVLPSGSLFHVLRRGQTEAEARARGWALVEELGGVIDEAEAHAAELNGSVH